MPDGDRVTRSVDRHEVRLLDQQRATWAKRGHHAPKSQALVWQPLDQPPLMHEVETGRQLFGGDVVAEDVEPRIATRCCLEEFRLKIRGDDDTARTDTLRQPERYRSTATSRRRVPGPTPRRLRCARVPGSSADSSAASRTRSNSQACSYS